MSYRLIYDQPEASRVIMAVLIDKRAAIPDIKNKAGSVVKAFVDTQVSLVTSSTLFYKIETDTGHLAGYFTLQVVRTGVVALLQFELRAAFEQFNSQITQNINNFIASGQWSMDVL